MVRNRCVRNWRGEKIFHSHGGVITDQYPLYYYNDVTGAISYLVFKLM